MDLREEGYWDSHYELELKNYREDGDEGEIWFGKGLNRKIVSWLINKFPDHEEDKTVNIIDIGCGNAFTLCSLAEKLQSKRIKLLGIDYSNNSIALSSEIVNLRDLKRLISLSQCDFLDHTKLVEITNDSKFQYIIDKGTYDAICLLSKNLTLSKDRYLRSLYSLVTDGSILILASCNHTKEELLKLMETECETKWINCCLIDEIETPKLQFGGQEGSQVTCLIFKFAKSLSL